MLCFGNITENNMTQKNQKAGRKFLTERLRAHIGSGARRFQTMCTDYFWIRHNPAPRISADPCQYIVEQSVDISLRPSDYERLLDILGHYDQFGNLNAYEQYRSTRLEYEKTLRKQYPAVQLAYDRYQTLLTMIANGVDLEE
jgi:hypothetical protein